MPTDITQMQHEYSVGNDVIGHSMVTPTELAQMTERGVRGINVARPLPAFQSLTRKVGEPGDEASTNM